MVRADRLSGLLLLAVAVWYGVESRTFATGALSGPVGPGAFPLLLAVLLGAFSLTLVVRPDPDPEPPSSIVWVRGGTIIASTVAYAYLLAPLGFVVATSLEFALIGMFFGGRPRRTVAAAVGMTLVTFYLFDRVLGLPLPTGTIFGA